MTASYKANAKKSNFTLALLEGTGWYKPDYTVAESLIWGNNRGCNFIDDYCIDQTTKKTNFVEFCDGLSQKTCTLDRRYKASCSIQPYSGSPAYITWNYFGNGALSIDEFSDNCPYPISLSNGDCYYSGTESAKYDEAFGVDARCFEGTLVKSSFLPESSMNSFCFKYQVSKAI